MHDDGGARVGHAFEEAASGQADDAHAGTGREGEQVALRFAGDIRRTAEQGRDVGTEQGQQDGDDGKESKHPDALLEVAADLRAVVAAVRLRDGSGDGERAAGHEKVDEAEDLCGECHRSEGEVAVAPRHDGINNRLGVAQELQQYQRQGEAQRRRQFVSGCHGSPCVCYRLHGL